MDNELRKAFEMANKVREHAYTPYSGFKVGAVIVSTRTGAMYAGCNVENASYGATICAERNAILTAAAEEGIPVVETDTDTRRGEGIFSFMVVVADTKLPTPPCAQCLQVMAEFCGPDFRVYLGNREAILSELAFSDLLPFPFDGNPLKKHG